MDYEKLHKNALEIGKKLIERNPELKEWVESKFPELKEDKEVDTELENLLLDYYEMIRSSDHEYEDEITNEYSKKIVELVKNKLMKDLPIWHNVKKSKGSDKEDYTVVGYYLVKRGYGIYLKDLEKLPKEE